MGGNGPTRRSMRPSSGQSLEDAPHKASPVHAERRHGLAVVMGMLDRECRQVRAKVIPNVRRETLAE